MQHLNGHEQFHRRALERRQIRRVTTTVVTEAETTFTSTFTTRVPLIELPRPTDDEEEEEETTTTRRRSSSSSVASSTRPASSSAATARPTAASSSVLSSAVSSSATSRPTASSTSDDFTSVVTSIEFETNKPSPLPTESSLAGTAPEVTGAKSAGQVAGIVVGVIAGVIGVAIFAAFIVRHMRKRANEKEWDAAKFRQSALLLNDEKPGGGGSGRGPRPPSMIERREGSVRNVPPPTRAYPYTDAPGSPATFSPQDQLGYNRVGTPHQPQQYGAPNPYGAAPMPYMGQNMYGQGADRGYGGNMGAGFGAAGAGYGQPQGMEHPGFPNRQNGAHNSLPPFASYAPRLEMDGHAFGPAAAVGAGNVSRTNTTASHFPNPFSERAPQVPPSPQDSGSLGHGSSESGAHTGTTAAASNRGRFMTRNGDEDNDVQDSRDAPPAYIDDGTYAKMQRDVKTPVVMSVEGTTTPAPVPTPKPATPAPAPAPAPAAMGNNKARPMSSHTVYDPSDAYGGM